MYDDMDFLDDELLSQYPIIQKLGMIPAVLITGSSELRTGGAVLAKAPWDIVVVTDYPENEQAFYQEFQMPSRNVLVKNNNEFDLNAINPSKKELQIIIPPQCPPEDYWEYDGANVLERVACEFFKRSGVIFINNIPEGIYGEGLKSAVRSLNPRRSVYLIGCQGGAMTTKWVTEKLYATNMPPEAARCIGEFYSEDYRIGNEGDHIYVNKELITVKADDSAKISSFGNLLTCEDLECETLLSKKDYPYAFRQFLDRSVGGIPDWYCYNPEVGFHLKRNIEDKLTRELNKALDEADSHNNAKAVLLSGQAYSGKTNILCALAYRIFTEHRYPVIYIPHTENITDKAIEEYKKSLDYLLRRIEDTTRAKTNQQRVVPALIVWDTSCRQKKDLDLALSLLQKLRNEKRQVQLLFSAYELSELPRNKCILQKVEATLETEEIKNLISILQDKGGFLEAETEHCVNKFARNPHFLASLYKFRELHQNMESHIKRETEAKNDDLEEILADITKQSLDKNLNNSLAILLEQFDFGDSDTSSQENTQDNKIGEQLNEAITCVALCTFYGCSVPIKLFLGLIASTSLGPIFYTAISNHTLLREQGDDDDFELVIRSPLEAEFILRNTDRLSKLIYIINKIEVSNAKEIELIRKLVQTMGPNCHFTNKSKYSLWETEWRNFQQVWEALARLREQAETPISQIKLLPQELSLMREYYYKRKDATILNTAYQLAQSAYSAIKDSQGEDLLKANIIVEYCELSRDMDVNLYDLYKNIREPMLELAYDSNRYVQQTLLRLGLDCYQKMENTDEKFKLLAQMHYWGSAFIDNADFQLQRTIAEIYRKIDSIKSDNTLDDLIKRRVSAAVYLKAIQVKRKIDTLPETSERNNYRKQYAEEILQYLRDYDWIREDSQCVFLLIEMLWMSKSGLNIIPDEELNCVGLLRCDWLEIKNLCDLYKRLESYCPEITFLSAVTELHLGNYESGINYLGQYNKTMCKKGQWYFICNENGIPYKFNGKVKRMHNSNTYGWLEAYDTSGNVLKDVFFRSYDIGGASQVGQMINGSFYISISSQQLEARRMEK